MIDAYIALGSNLGNSEALIRKAFDFLANLSAAPISRSSICRTAPVNCPPGSPDFHNAVCRISLEDTFTPENLLVKLQSLEKEFGRHPKEVMNEPRPLDLDIIAFGQIRMNTPILTIPHPQAHLRKFVLVPLAEISPELVLPGFQETVTQLLSRCESA